MSEFVENFWPFWSNFWPFAHFLPTFDDKSDQRKMLKNWLKTGKYGLFGAILAYF